MRAVIQRVSSASVEVNGVEISRISTGILTLLGIEGGDSREAIETFLNKLHKLRIFEDVNGKMNASIIDVSGSHLIVSQFTLCADLSKGNRPGFSKAANPDEAKALYDFAIQYSLNLGIPTFGGVFGADMKVHLINDGPATFFIN